MNFLTLVNQSRSNVQATIIAYPPSGGGNHLKNLLCLSGAFANSGDLNLEPYNTGNREVHSTPGRNMNEYRMADALFSTGDFILHGHFGELAPFRSEINNIEQKKFVITDHAIFYENDFSNFNSNNNEFNFFDLIDI